MGHSEVVTFDRYRARILERADLRGWDARIRYVSGLNDLAGECSRLIIAVNPRRQAEIVGELVKAGWRGRLLLEKPVAPSPDEANQTLIELERASIEYGVGFSMMSCNWFSALRALFARGWSEPAEIDMSWLFRAYHHSSDIETWKRRKSEGGGALRYFAIHLVAVLASLADWTVTQASMDDSEPDAQRWCRFRLQSGNVRASCECDTAATEASQFRVVVRTEVANQMVVNEPDPFVQSVDFNHTEIEDSRGRDRRVTMLKEMLIQFERDPKLNMGWYHRHIGLWKNIEDWSA
jgi:predicted dehydrogenase